MAPEYIPGDATGDGVVNSQDIATIQGHMLGIKELTGINFLAADISKDSQINALDIGLLQKILLQMD